jgi:hypothetical protein
MRAVTSCLIVFPFWASLAVGRPPQSHPVPPGVREADKLPNPADVPPQIKPQRRPADPAQVKRDADELARLAQSIPAQVEQVTRGQLPKDLTEQLKRIEKLSRQLRREVSR